MSDAPNLLEIVRGYHGRGWPPVPIPYRGKFPVIDGWPDLLIAYDDLPAYFEANGQRQNAGVLLGDAAGGLVDVDCDSPLAIALADRLLDRTASVFGRPGAPRAHRLYRCPSPVPGTEQFRAPDGSMIIELRGTRGQTVFPGSWHKDTGERIAWEADGEPAPTTWDVLLRQVQRIAAGVLLVPHWTKGKRHDLTLALAGALLRHGWARKEVAGYVVAIARTAPSQPDLDVAKVWRDVDSTEKNLQAGEKVTGVPKLAELIGDEATAKLVVSWLHLGRGGGSEANGRNGRADEDAGSAEAADQGQRAERGRESQAAKLVSLAAGWDLFHTPDGVPYVTLPGPAGEHQTWPLQTKAVRQWLERLYHVRHGGVAHAQAVQDAFGVLAGRARFEGAERGVALRLAEYEGTIYLDLCDRTWRVVEVTGQGWRVTASKDAPVRFRRTKGMLALPEPRRGGSIADLRPFVNVPAAKDDDSAWRLVVAWLVAALRPRGPYPILVCAGEQGSAKSTLQRVLRALVDPHRVPLRRPPRDERDLAIAAANSWVVALENLSSLPDWLSDTICALATGGGYGTRMLYENDEEALFDAQRPVMLNGIPVVVTRGDALDRSLILRMPAIADDKRQVEEEFWSDFESARPAILGALLDAVSTALRRKAAVQLKRLPRMADFALWLTAAEPGLGWTDGSFMATYDAERAGMHEVALQASVVAAPLWEFVKGQEGRSWSGTATQLLDALNGSTDEATRKRKGWPALPHHLSGELSRLAPHLRALGLTVSMARTGRKRTVDLQLEEKGKPASSASSASQHAQGGDADRPVGDADWPVGDADVEPVYAQNDAGDAGDADLRQYSKRALAWVADVSHEPKTPHPTEPCPKGHQEWEFACSDPHRGEPRSYGYVCRGCRPVDQYGCWLPGEACDHGHGGGDHQQLDHDHVDHDHDHDDTLTRATERRPV